MNPEPLTKEKLFVLDISYPMSLAKIPESKPTEKYIVFFNDVKSAVEWLLKEIEKETNKYLDTYSHPDDEALRRILEAFSISITEKIKKAFSGVIEDV